MNLFIGTTSVDKLDKKVLSSCDELIERVAKIEGVDLVFGGYGHGIMKKCYDEFKKNNKKVISATVEVFKNELKDIPSDKELVEKTTFSRLEKIYQNSDMFLILPGGIGTLAELFSLIEEMRTNENNKMLVIYNKDYFYKDILEKLYDMYQNKLIEYPPSEYMLISNDIDEIITVIENF